MSITSAAGIAQAAALGCQRVVLARELALRDLERLQTQLAQRNLVMPLEVFEWRYRSIRLARLRL